MSGKEALYHMTDCIDVCIAALEQMNGDESNKVISVLKDCRQYGDIVYDELDKRGAKE